DHADFEPYYDIAETLFATCGDRGEFNDAVTKTSWYKAFKELDHFSGAGNWKPSLPFHGEPYPMTPVGFFFFDAMRRRGLNPVMLANSMVSPGSRPYETRQAIKRTLAHWKKRAEKLPGFWAKEASALWSERTRDACNMCGYCGEFTC